VATGSARCIVYGVRFFASALGFGARLETGLRLPSSGIANRFLCTCGRIAATAPGKRGKQGQAGRQHMRACTWISPLPSLRDRVEAATGSRPI